jgi:phenylpropionate dioxygenase-like ring-hydroxylating dioxygenase large terminal subunit
MTQSMSMLRSQNAARFGGFANVWTPVVLSRALSAKKPLPVTVAGERLVFFRDAHGKAAALIDTCPHRGVALSLGKIQDGCLTCPFHGWRFNGSGEVVHVPWNPDAKLHLLKAQSLHVVESGGLVWMHTSLAQTPPPPPAVPEELLQASVTLTGQSIKWKTHWTRAMENMLDWPHLPFIHAGTIGRGMLGRRDAKMDIVWQDTEFGATTSIDIDGKRQDGVLDYLFPHGMRLHIPIPGRLFRMVVYCIPIDDEHTEMLFLSVRDFLKPRLFNPIFNAVNRRVANEDKAVLESSFPIRVPSPAFEKSVRTDAPTLNFRARFRRELETSSAVAPHSPAREQLKSTLS